MIPSTIQILHNKLPDEPGVYFYYDHQGTLLYIGKATSLRTRVGSYFTKAHENRIAEMVSRIARIEYMVTPTVIEALVLEANQIKTKRPVYNILMRDDKSFMYLVVTNEKFPRPKLMRGHELERMGIDPFRPRLTKTAAKKFLRVFGPYTSSASLRKAMELIRRAIPWSECQPPSLTGRTRPCFHAHLGKCPGVCSGNITQKEYRAIMRQFVLFFEGKKTQLIRVIEQRMQQAAAELRFEDAAIIRRQLYALNHIQDVALISKEDLVLPYTLNSSLQDSRMIDPMGRIEAYDISNISGDFAVGSMVVFEEGKPAKGQYRKFKIKSVKGANDVAMMEEVMHRRLTHALRFPNTWPLPHIMVIDGGEIQVNRVQQVLDQFNISIPIVGIAKGSDRKQDRLIFDRSNLQLARIVPRAKPIFQSARDEAHRFAVKYHRSLRSKEFIKK